MVAQVLGELASQLSLGLNPHQHSASPGWFLASQLPQPCLPITCAQVRTAHQITCCGLGTSEDQHEFHPSPPVQERVA
jgi:hypothetical protein